MQELCMSCKPIVCCGERRMAWCLLADACDNISGFHLVEFLYSYDNTFSLLIQLNDVAGLVHIQLMQAMRISKGPVEKCWEHGPQEMTPLRPLEELLRIMTDFEVSDPRDRIFALLGLATDGEDSRLAPNYQLSVVEVYTRTAIYLLETSRAMWVLYMGYGNGPSPTRPSWVPNWECREALNFRRFFGLREDAHHAYKAAGTKEFKFRFATGCNRLIITGMKLDTITATTSMCKPIKVPSVDETQIHLSRRISEFIEEARSLAMSLTTSFSDSEEWYAAFWRTLCGNYSGDEYPAPKHWQHALDITTNFYLYELARRTGDTEKSKTYSQKTLESSDKMRNALPHERSELVDDGVSIVQFTNCIMDRRFCVTEKGHMSLVTEYAQPGDLLCILFGGRVPFVLRPSRPDDHSCREFRIVGEAYVHGVMHGEVFDSADVEAEEFTII